MEGIHYFAGYRVDTAKQVQMRVVTVMCENTDDMQAIAKALPDLRWLQGMPGNVPSIDIPSAI